MKRFHRILSKNGTAHGDEPSRQPHACLCHQGRLGSRNLAKALKCVPSYLCFAPYSRDRVLNDTVFLSVLHYDPNDVRSSKSTSHRPEIAYSMQLLHLHRLVASLQRVNCSLGMYLLVSGKRNRTAEAALERRGVRIQPMPPIKVPWWASPYHRSSFFKLHAFNFSFRTQHRVILLDTDVSVLRNIDHLSLLPTPAMVTRPRSIVNTGVMVLRVRLAAELDELFEYFRWSLDLRHSEVQERFRGDGGDQQLLLHYFASKRLIVNELPSKYNAYPTDYPAGTPWWASQLVLHKPQLASKLSKEGNAVLRRLEPCRSCVDPRNNWRGVGWCKVCGIRLPPLQTPALF